MPVPALRSYGSATETAQSPEGLLISALLEIGDFVPERFHVTVDDAEAWRRLWQFCEDYQRSAGVAPPLSLVRQRFPDFEVTKDINPSWAALQVAEAASSRRLRSSIQSAIGALADDDVESAYEALEQVRRPPTLQRAAVSMFDPMLYVTKSSTTKIEVPYPTLGRATGGIGMHELWFFAARLGAGKTWVLSRFAARAADCGYNVGVISLEMTAVAYATRIARILCGHDADLLAQLTDGDHGAQQEVIAHLRKTTPGAIDIRDPGFGDVGTTGSVAAMSKDYDLLLVDHVGLMKTAKGDRAIEDWRTMATISNVLREITLTGASILGAAQINREGDRSGRSRRPPKASTISQSDALGQDASVLVTGQRNSERVMSFSAEKVREGQALRWYARFQPATNRWEEITPDLARELEVADEMAKDDDE